MKKKFQAFSLIETILSMLIIGILISSIYPMFSLIIESRKRNINSEKYEYIRNAMQNYLIQHGKLPYASQNLNDGLAKENIYIGFVPYKTLGISKKYAYDSNNKPFKYAVNHYLTQTNLPFCMPHSIKIQKDQRSFCRFYKFENNELIYDELCNASDQLILLENNESIIDQNDYFYIMKPIKKFNTMPEISRWIENSLNLQDNFKNCNVVAWILISFGKNLKQNECHEMNKTNEPKFCLKSAYCNDQVFFQTRFDMAAQTGFYCTSEPIYE